MRRNWDLSMMVLIIILAFSSFRNGAFSSPMEWLMNKLMFLPAIIIGLSLHEYAHAKVAYKLGDPTPKMQGRCFHQSIGTYRLGGIRIPYFCRIWMGKTGGDQPC